MSYEKLEARIVERGSEWCVVSKSGDSLGCYSTKEEAQKRLRQVEYFKHQGAIEAKLVAKESPNLRKVDAQNKAISSSDAQSIIDRNTI